MLSNTDYYFIEKDGKLHPLTNEDVRVELRGYQMTKKSNNYVGILNWLMSDAEGLRPEIYSTKLNHSSLIQLSKDYHNMVCKGQKCIVYYKMQKSKNDTKWYVTAGIVTDYIAGSIDMDVSLINTSYLVSNDFGNSQLVDRFITTSTNSQFKSSISGLAPGFYLNFNRNSRFSFEVQLKYQYLKNSQVQVDKIQIPFFMNYDLMRYTKAIPYMIIGLGNDFYAGFKGVKPFYANYNYLTDISFEGENILPVYTPNVIRYKQEHIVNKRYQPSILAGMGLSYELPNHKKVKLEIIGSYSHIKNDHYVDIHSETKITSLAFSCKYEL